MALSESLLEIRSYDGLGYTPLVDFASWRVAVLRYADECLPQNINDMQRHDETDEVFVLLAGRCVLYLAEGEDTITNVYAQDMEPLKLYNVKRGVWHAHTQSEDATVLIVENRDTTLENSTSQTLNEQQQETLQALVPDWLS